MRFMMNELMHVTDHYNDATYKEVQDFMVPESVGGTFNPEVLGRSRRQWIRA